MTASERSYLGLAKQTAKGTINSVDAEFDYLLFTGGQVGPQNRMLPLDREVGGGAFLRSLVKVGVTSVGQFQIIPRPKTLGSFLLGAIGSAAAPVDNTDGSYDHVFTLPTDEFDAPYFTMRSAPGGLWGETFQDARVAALGLTWRAANYLRGTVGLLGGMPTPAVSMTSWNAASQVDSGPQFLAPVSTVELPTGSAAKVLSGGVAFGMDIPLDEQWVTGSYEPDAFDINGRQIVITLGVKITDGNLYEKMMYDPDQAGAWTTKLFREADFVLEFASDQDAGTTPTPYSLLIEANGQSGDDANVIWSAQPIGLQAGRQVTMAVTGTFLASAVGEVITATLTNQQATQY